MKYLVVGLGNVGSEYENTRHNSGFIVAEALAKDLGATWSLGRHAFVAEGRYKGRSITIIRPTTYMNLSGKAVKYWMQQERIPVENILVVVDDIALPIATLRMKKQGSGGGHNGLADIETHLGHNNYCRLRVGVGNNFSRGRQIDYVLGQFTSEEMALLEPQIANAVEMIKVFCTEGPDRAMNRFNGGNAKQEKKPAQKEDSKKE